MAVNKVIYGGETLMDITDSTVTPETLAQGVSGYNAAGERIIGTMTGGASSWNDLTDRPFGEIVTYGDTLTWDGNTDGKVFVDVFGNGRQLFCLVSDVVPTLNDFANGGKFAGTFDEMEFTADDILPLGDGVLVESGFNFGIIPRDNMTVTVPYGDLILSVTYPKKGVYFGKGVGHIASLTINGYTGFETTEIKTIDYKYLPEALHFGGAVEYLDKLTWDGDTTGLDVVTMTEGYAYLYRVSDAVPTLEELSAGFTCVSTNGAVASGGADDIDILGDTGAYMAGGALFVPYDGMLVESGGSAITFPKKGTYFIQARLDEGGPLNWTMELSINNYKFIVGEIKPIDTKYLPEHLQFGGDSISTDELIWDGNTEGFEYIDVLGDGSAILCHISGATPTLEDFANGASYVLSDGHDEEIDPENGMHDLGSGAYIESNNMAFVVVSNDNTTVTAPFMNSMVTLTFPKKGIYFSAGGGMHTQSLVINGYTFEWSNIKPLDTKYLPESHQFGETTTMGDTLTWDGDESKVLTLDATGTGQLLICHVSDVVPTIADFEFGGKFVFGLGGEREYEAGNIIPIMGWDVGVLANDQFNFVVIPSDNMTVTAPYEGMTLTITFPKKGIYFGKTVGVNFVSSLTINGYTGFETTEVKTMDAKYLPTDYIQSMIDSSLGVIENGSY